VLLTVAVVGAVAWQFTSILRNPELWKRPLRPAPAWLAAAAALYLMGLGFCALFWYWLLRALGQHPRIRATIRAYYVGQLGRYVPGKVVGVLFRARLMSGPGVRMSVAVLTVVYEALATLASGAFLAVLFFISRAWDHDGMGWKALGLLALVGVPLLPGVFNRLVRQISRPFLPAEAAPLPRVRGLALSIGLALAGCGWVVQGAGLWALVEAVQPGAWPWSWEAWAHATAFIALAYVAGFLVVAVPGGLGVREFLLQQFLAAEFGSWMDAPQAAGAAVVVALMSRLLSLIADVAAAGVFYWLPGQAHKG
jgi:hypothetical protein